MVQSWAVQPKRMTSYHNTSPLWQKCPCFVCSCFWGFVQNDKVSPLLFSITHTPWACMGWPCTQLSSVTIEELSAAMAITRSVLPGTLLPVPGTEKSTLPFEFQSAKQTPPRKKKTNPKRDKGLKTKNIHPVLLLFLPEKDKSQNWFWSRPCCWKWYIWGKEKAGR